MPLKLFKEDNIMKHTSKEFTRKEIHRIATAYSTGKYTYYDFLDEHPGCLKSTFYDIISKAVVESIVSDSTMEAIEIMAVANSSNKMEDISKKFANEVAHRGRKCNAIRRVKRNSYIPPKSTAVKWIDEYLSTQDSKVEFCKSHYMTTKLFDRTLKNAIIKSWIRLDVVERLRQKAYHFYDEQKVNKTFDALVSMRKQLKTSKSKKAKVEQ